MPPPPNFHPHFDPLPGILDTWEWYHWIPTSILHNTWKKWRGLRPATGGYPLPRYNTIWMALGGTMSTTGPEMRNGKECPLDVNITFIFISIYGTWDNSIIEQWFFSILKNIKIKNKNSYFFIFFQKSSKSTF